MKKIITLTFSALLFLLCAFRPIKGLEDVINALRSGNAGEVARFIEDDVEITLPDKSDTYSKAQGTVILKDFFAQNKVVSFEVKHKGDNGGSQFCIGTLVTRSGDYRTTIFMKTKNGRQVMKALQFQAQGAAMGRRR